MICINIDSHIVHKIVHNYLHIQSETIWDFLVSTFLKIKGRFVIPVVASSLCRRFSSIWFLAFNGSSSRGRMPDVTVSDTLKVAKKCQVESSLALYRGRGGHAAMNPAISCSNPGSSQNPVRTPQKPVPTPRKPVPTPPKTVQKITF